MSVIGTLRCKACFAADCYLRGIIFIYRSRLCFWHMISKKSRLRSTVMRQWHINRLWSAYGVVMQLEHSTKHWANLISFEVWGCIGNILIGLLVNAVHPWSLSSLVRDNINAQLGVRLEHIASADLHSMLLCLIRLSAGSVELRIRCTFF